MTAADDAPIRLFVNGEAREVARGATVATLLGELGVAGDGTAVAVDDVVVARSAHAGRALAAGARVEILHAVAGG